MGYVLGSHRHACFLGEFYRAWNEQIRQSCAWCSAHGKPVCEILDGIDQYSPDQGFAVALSRTRARLLVDSSKRIAWAERFIAPDCYFRPYLVHLIRDPRAWYASERRRRRECREELLAGWVRENTEIRSFLQQSNVPSTAVFYDELAASPEPEFQKLCSRIGVTFEPTALQYWRKPHHAFAANGASSFLLSSAPSTPDWMVTGDDHFYEENRHKYFVDARWKTQLSEADALAITENPRVAAFLNLYDRVLVAETLQHLTSQERSMQLQCFSESTPQL